LLREMRPTPELTRPNSQARKTSPSRQTRIAWLFGSGWAPCWAALNPTSISVVLQLVVLVADGCRDHATAPHTSRRSLARHAALVPESR